MKSLVSAIVTSYNHADYIVQRMESLATQTYDNIEIIVVDDNSKDNSVEVLKSLKNRINFRLIILESNVGYAQACNIGVSASQGEYIIFAESDDYSDVNQIKKLKHKADECKAGVVFSASNMVDGLGRKFGEDFFWREKKFRKICLTDTRIKPELMRVFFLYSCVIPNMSAALIKKNLINKIGGFDISYSASADWDFWCRLSENTNFYYIREPLNNFRQHMYTVRTLVLKKKSGVFLQMSEVMKLLNHHAERINCSFISRAHMNIVVARLWFNFFISNPRACFRDYILVSNKFNKYTKLWPAYLFFGIFSKIIIWAHSRAKDIFSKIS